jgi:hypothetical protein
LDWITTRNQRHPAPRLGSQRAALISASWLFCPDVLVVISGLHRQFDISGRWCDLIHVLTNRFRFHGSTALSGPVILPLNRHVGQEQVQEVWFGFVRRMRRKYAGEFPSVQFAAVPCSLAVFEQVNLLLGAVAGAAAVGEPRGVAVYSSLGTS